MPPTEPLSSAKRFAAALDRCDFIEAGRYVAPDCHYQTGREELVGPDAILASYRDNAVWASHALEQVIYESEVEETSDDFSVLFIDRIMHQGQTHEYRCRQHLSLNHGGQVVRIVHEELPGERERLNDFFGRHGVIR